MYCKRLLSTVHKDFLQLNYKKMNNSTKIKHYNKNILMANKHIKYIPHCYYLGKCTLRAQRDSFTTTRVALIIKIENAEYC